MELNTESVCTLQSGHYDYCIYTNFLNILKNCAYKTTYSAHLRRVKVGISRILALRCAFIEQFI